MERQRLRRRSGRWGRTRSGVALLAAGLLIGVVTTVASSTPASDGNPNMESVCGLDLTLVLDDSNSIDNSEASQIRDAASRFSSALVGTPSRVKTVVFDSRSTGIAAGGGSTSDPAQVAFRDPADYTAPTSGDGQGGTNWDDGLELVRRSAGGPGDLVVFLTDGNPTYRNEDEPDGHAVDGSHDLDGNGSDVSADNLSAAVYEADAIKAAGAHMFGIGIGLSGSSGEQRLNDVTGDEELTLDASGEPNLPFGQADYTVAPDFDDLEAIVEAFVRDLCAPSLNVTKVLQRADGTVETAGLGEPWTFTATISPTPDDWTTPEGASGATAVDTTDEDGAANFTWEHDEASSATVDLVETPLEGWVYNGATCTRNLLNNEPPVSVLDTARTNAAGQSGDPDDLLDLEVGIDEALNCTVYNREIRGGAIQVAKVTVPAGLDDAFDITVSDGNGPVAAVEGIGHGDVETVAGLAPGTYAVAEADAEGYELTSAVCDDLGTEQVTETASPVELVVDEAQTWRCTFTNTADPGTVTVVKNTTGADGTFAFNSDVPDLGDFELTTQTGTAATATITVPVGTYHLSEDDPSPWQLTDAICSPEQEPSQFFVGPGEDVTCRFENLAPDPTIQVTKTALTPTVAEPGGPATFAVTVTNTSVEPVHIDTIVDSIGGGPDLDLTAVAGPITATDCSLLEGVELGVVAPFDTASCTFTATVSGNGGAAVGDLVTVEAYDDDEDTASDSDDASVDITDVAPALAVTKTPSVSTLAEPGGTVSYTVGITNTGAEEVEIDAVTDLVEGGAPFDVTTVAAPVTATTCDSLVGTALAASGSTSCTFSIAHVVDRSELVDGDLDDTVAVTGHDDDGEVTATGDAEVPVTDTLPSVAVTKTPSPGTIAETAPGSPVTVTYLVTIQNTSAEAATIDSIADSVEGGAPYAVGGTCASLVGTTLAAQAGTSCTFTAPVSGNAGDEIDDVVTVTVSDDDENQASDTADATVTVTGLPSSIAVTKVADPPSVPEPGGPVTYTVGITNTSVADAVTLGSITDSVEGGAPHAVDGTCTALLGTTLAPGGTTACAFATTVSGNAGDVVDDLVTVAGTDDDGEAVSGTAEESVTLTDVPSSIAVTKTPSPSSVVEPGGPVTFTVGITNTSVADAVTLTSITDSVEGGPPGAVGGSCAALVGTTLAPGEGPVTCTFTATVGGQPGDTVTDTVAVGGIDDDQGEVSSSASAVVDVVDAASSIAVTKVASPSSVPEPGGDVTFIVGIDNTSTADTVTIDGITDSIDGGPAVAAGGTCPALLGASLEPGESTSCEFTTAVAGNAGDTIADTVTVTGYDDDEPVAPAPEPGIEATPDAAPLAFGGGDAPEPDEPVTTNARLQAQASAIVSILDVPPEGTVTKTPTPATVVEPGGPVTFDVVVTNTSAVESATITAIADLVDGSTVDVTQVTPPVSGTTCATGTVLAPGGSYTCDFTLVIADANAGDTIVDQLTVTLTDDEQNSVAPDDTAAVTVTDALPSISVVKDNGDASIEAPGGSVAFEVDVTNTSPAESVTITALVDAVDGGPPFDIATVAAPVTATTCATGGSLAPGETYHCSFTLEVSSDEAAVEGDVVTATAVDDESNQVTAADDATSTVTPVADLAIEKALDGELMPGATGTYLLELTNLGPSQAVGVQVVDQLPEGLVPVSGSGDGWACAVDVDAGTVACERPSLDSGATSTVTVEVQIDESMAGTGVINVATVAAETADRDPSNNRDELPGDVRVLDQSIDRPPTAEQPARAGAPGGSGVVDRGTLARTGSDPGPLEALGLTLLGAGALLLLVRRRHSAT